MPNSQYERDFNDLGALKRPGRLDFKTLNNVDDAGDGYPGMQKAIRNYFHEGYLEKDINMNTHKIINLQAPSGDNDGARKVDVDTVQNDLDGFDDELKSLSSVEVQQLQNIDSVTISNTQWGYVGSSNQGIATSNTPSFTGLTLTGNLALVANSITGTGVDISNAELQQLTNIASATISGVQWGYLGALNQSLAQAQSPTFVGLTLSANLVTTSTVDSVDVSTFKSSYDNHVASATSHIDNITDIPSRDHDDLANKDANSVFLHSTSAEQINWNAAFTHKSNDGSDHSYIDQSVVVGSAPSFGKATFSAGQYNNRIVKISNTLLHSDSMILDLDFSSNSTAGLNNKFIRFMLSGGEVGAVHSEVVYGTFTGSHDSQTEAGDLDDWETGMIVISTGKIIGKPSMGRSLPECDLSRTKQDKCVFGVYNGMEKKHNKKGFDRSKPSLCIHALGEGQILVTDTNGNINVGDYIQSSSITGLGEKQDDDILHNYTVAKATQAVNWYKIKTKNGIKKMLIACTYHCG